MASTTDIYTLQANIQDRMSRKLLILDRLVNRFGGGFLAMGRNVALAGTAVGVAITGILAKMTDLAMKAEETKNLMQLAFRRSKEDVEDWASTMSDSLGMNRYQMLEHRTNLKLLANEMAISQDQGDAFSDMFVRLAGDIRSAFNVPGGIENVMVKLRAGLTGEYEPLRRVNVYLSEVAVNAKAAELGFEKTNNQYSQTAKFLSRVNLIMEGTKQVHGDLAATLGSTTNQFERAKNKTSELATEIGSALLPVANELLTTFNQWLGENKDWAINLAVTGVETAIDTVLKVKDTAVLAADIIKESWSSLWGDETMLGTLDNVLTKLNEAGENKNWLGSSSPLHFQDSGMSVWKDGDKSPLFVPREDEFLPTTEEIEEEVTSFEERFNAIWERKGIELSIGFGEGTVDEEARQEGVDILEELQEEFMNMGNVVDKHVMVSLEDTNKELEKMQDHFADVNAAASPAWDKLQDINEELALINQATVPVDQSVFDQIVTDLLEINKGLDDIQIPEKLRQPLEDTYNQMVQMEIATDDFGGALDKTKDDMDDLKEKTVDWSGAFQRAFEGGGNLLGGFKSIMTDLFSENINIKLGGGKGLLGELGNMLGGALSGGLSSLVGFGLSKIGGWIGGMFKSDEEKKAERREKRAAEESEEWDNFTRKRGHKELYEAAGLDPTDHLDRLYEAGSMMNYNQEIERLEELAEAREAERLEIEKATDSINNFTTNLLQDLTGINEHPLEGLRENFETLGKMDIFENLKSLYDDAVIDVEGTKDAAGRWFDTGKEDDNFTMLGKAFKAAELSESLQAAASDFTLLLKSGMSEARLIKLIDKDGIKDINEMVENASKLGVTVPESMRPILEAMDKAGTLTTDFENIEFGSGLTEPMDALVVALGSLIDELGGELPEALRTYLSSFETETEDIPPIEVPVEPDLWSVNDITDKIKDEEIPPIIIPTDVGLEDATVQLHNFYDSQLEKHASTLTTQEGQTQIYVERTNELMDGLLDKDIKLRIDAQTYFTHHDVDSLGIDEIVDAVNKLKKSVDALS